MNFRNKVAVVTGAAGDMGFTISELLSKNGADILMIDIEVPKKKLPPKSIFSKGDITNKKFLKENIDKFAKNNNGIHLLVNCAGVLWFDRDKSLLDIDLDIWDQVLNINLKGAALAARYTIPWMKKSGFGSMVHISSIQALRGDIKAQDAYGASKAGLLALSKSLAIQLAKNNIRSNAILPGAIKTQMQKRWIKDESLAKTAADHVPIGRLGSPTDIANATSFLLSESSSYITGIELIVDGGVTALP